MQDFKYKLENMVLIKHVWEKDPSMLIQTFNHTLDTKMNYITKAVKVNLDESKFGDSIKEGDVLFLSRYITSCRKFELSESYVNDPPYSNIPASLVFGKFKDNNIHVDSLEMFYDKVLLEPITDIKEGSILLTENSKCNIGRVKKVGSHHLFRDFTKRDLLVKENDIILYWNNTETILSLDCKQYQAIEEMRIIGIFKDGIVEIENLQMLDGRVLLRDLQEEKLDLNSNLIFLNKENNAQFEFQSNPEHYYEIFKIGEKGKEVSKNVFIDNGGIEVGDTVVVKEDFIQHVYFKGVLYYTLDNIVNNAEAIIKK